MGKPSPFKIVSGKRMPKVIALCKHTSQREKRVNLLGLLDSFGKRFQLHAFPHRDDGADGCVVIAVSQHVAYEGNIDLQFVYRKTLEIGK